MISTVFRGTKSSVFLLFAGAEAKILSSSDAVLIRNEEGFAGAREDADILG